MFLGRYNYGGLRVKPSSFFKLFHFNIGKLYFLALAAPVKSHQHLFEAVEIL